MKKYFEENPDVQLIHVTDCFKRLESILTEQGFTFKYCKEEFCLQSKLISKRVHPMVCFTEQRPYDLLSKKITYGRYGIALSPDWIVKNNIQPVMYIEQNSQVANAIAQLLIQRRKLTKGHRLRLPIMTIACFTKNTIGNNIKLGKNDFLFKEENEWRYVPTKKQIGNGFISLDRSKYIADEEGYNKRLKDYPLLFDINTHIVNVYCDTEEDCKNLKNSFPFLKDRIIRTPWQI